MQLTLPRSPGRLLGIAAGALAGMSVLAVALRTPSIPKVTAVVTALLVPLFAYLTFSAPVIFPYGAYVLLMPFDGLLMLGKVGTLSKFLGFAAAVALLMWSARKKALVAMRLPLLAVSVLVLWSLCSAWWSIDPKVTLTTLPTYAGLIFLFGVLALVPITLRQYRMLLAAAVAGGIAAAAYGGYTFYTDPLLAAQDESARLFADSSHSAIDPNLFADSMLFPLAIALLAALQSTSIFRKSILYGVCALFCAAIILSASREAAIGVAVILMYYAVRTRHRLQIGIISAAALLAGSFLPNPLWDRFSSLDSPRQAIWSVGWEAFKHRWLTGYGLGSFIQVYDEFYLKVRQTYPNGWDSPAHNVAVHFTVELGAVGLLLIVALFVTQFLELRAIHSRSVLYDYRLMCEAGLIAVTCAAFFIDLFNAKWFWFVLAMAAQLRNMPRELREPQSDRHKLP